MISFLVAEGVGRVQDIEAALKEKITTEVRSVVLGHVQKRRNSIWI